MEVLTDLERILQPIVAFARRGTQSSNTGSAAEYAVVREIGQPREREAEEIAQR